MVTTGVSTSRRPRTCASSEARTPFLRVEPKAASLACLNFSLRASAKNSMSRGLEPGQPPSM